MDSLQGTTEASEIRAKLNHPVIDSDGHVIEYGPVVAEFLEQVAGRDMVKQFEEQGRAFQLQNWFGLAPETRERQRLGKPAFWATPARNTLDRATAVLPKLRRARMDAFGIDFAILYATSGLGMINAPDDDLRRALCRAYNTMMADLYGPYADRMTPAAVIPMFTPDEAIAELDHAIGTLGLKAIQFANFVVRPVPVAEGAPPDIARAASYLDPLALDSPYDYDPVWAKCMALGVAPTAHNTTFGMGLRRSTSNFMYNHCGHFAESGELSAKALFFGGVTRRFPGLNFAFLEGGVNWASTLFAGLVGRWHKRNGAMMEHFKPSNIDIKSFEELFDSYAEGVMAARRGDNVNANVRSGDSGIDDDKIIAQGLVDDFAACGIEKPEDIIDLFAAPFYFGCEADDRFAGLAISGELAPFNAKLNAIFGSDQGHWDVLDMNEVVAEAYELIEEGRMDDTQFRDFMFGGAVRLHGQMNRDFFKGTIVEDDAAKELAAS